MLNDVLSLCVGLWAVKMANRTSTPKMYTYGYQRAETLGALVNGVFLVALCVTIFLDAVARFVEPQEVSQPVLVLVVGCLGLMSNIVGLLLFHDHSHGPGGHSHANTDAANTAEMGHAETHRSHDHHAPHDHSQQSPLKISDVPVTLDSTVIESTLTAVESTSRATSPYRTRRKHSRSASKGILDFSGPRDFRHSIVEAASRIDPADSEENNDAEDESAENGEHDEHGQPKDNNYPPRMSEPLLGDSRQSNYETMKRKSVDHKSHRHEQATESHKGGGHSHGDLNMRGIFLHVMGDALGNLGVIATALIIWLTDYSWRFYFDPAISLAITVIILCSAIPLCKAASRILLQAVPHGIEVDDIENDIESLPGVSQCHDLHVWQLSDTKLIASLHVKVDFNFKDEGSERYMALAEDIRKCLHAYGIHSCTIQQEFEDSRLRQLRTNTAPEPAALRPDLDRECLLDCREICGDAKSCCPPPSQNGSDGHDGHDSSH